LLDVQDVGERHESITHRAQLLRPLEAERAPGLHHDLDLAVRDLADFLGKTLGVGGVEASVRPHRREIESRCAPCAAERAAAPHPARTPHEFPSREHPLSPFLSDLRTVSSSCFCYSAAFTPV